MVTVSSPIAPNPARPPASKPMMTRRMVAPLGAARTPKAEATTRDSNARNTSCGARAAQWPIAAYDRIPHNTAHKQIITTEYTE